ncbi:hypothetical protein KEM54_000511 [Ascosphaera aggregata]|nr:hypothetical protein KEM54_000511 [Ascosphaera aggregata]
MAVDKKDKKRKAVPAAAATKETQPPKKVKKDAQKAETTEVTTSKPAAKKSTKKTTNMSKDEPVKPFPVKVDDQPARQIKPRKRAADYLNDEKEGGEKKTEASSVAVDTANEPSSKKSKGQNGAAVAAPKVAEQKVGAKSQSIKVKKAKAPSPVEESSEEGEEEEEEEDREGSSEARDEGENSESDGEQGFDQTAALIQGFESSDDEDISGDEGFKPYQQVPAIPDSKQVKRKLKNKKKELVEQEEPGVVYVGRIPHGFYEHEMRAYFSQFGEIKRLRLSRNRKTGHSKHFAFIEFAATSVAKVVADTMNNYLMFGHILKCKYVPQEQVHPQLWKGANKRFKKTPWNDIERRRLEKPKSRDQWTKKIAQETKRRTRQAERLKAIGYDFQMPDLKKPEEILDAIAGQPAVEVEAPKAIEAAPSEKVEKTVTKVEPAKTEKKKGKKSEEVKERAIAQTASAVKIEKHKTQKTEGVKEKKTEEVKAKKVTPNKTKKNKKTKA